MTELGDSKPVPVFWASWKVRALGLTGFALSAVSAASADLNSSISPILYQATLLMTPILAVILGAVPLIIALAIAAFVLTLLGLILKKVGF